MLLHGDLSLHVFLLTVCPVLLPSLPLHPTTQAVADVDEPVPPSQAELSIHIFQLSDEGPANETVGGDGAGEEEVTTCSQWVLPALELDGLWENLIYDHEIKRFGPVCPPTHPSVRPFLFEILCAVEASFHARSLS